ncbi:MAG: methylamine utilization protein [Pirellulaceae bacterium]|nr:MAG: methylamine utilization protein [Pirellulaceae bacterium]
MRRQRGVFVLVSTVLFVGLVPGSVPPLFAQGWGNLKVRFVYGGQAPMPQPLQITKDQAFCGKFDVVDESRVVDPQTKGLANVVGFLYVSRTDPKKPSIHPSYDELKNKPVKLDNDKCRFSPHVAVVWTEQVLELGNSDEVAHNTNIATLNPANPPINQLIPAQKSIEHRFKQPENLPIPVACNIHPWMKGYVVVRDNPYAAVSNEKGELVIENIPAGEWKFRFWQEAVGYVSKVEVNGKPTTWTRGEVTVRITDGQTTDLGTVVVPASAFK